MTVEPERDWPVPAALNARLLGPVDLPFPIISPFAVRGDLQKLTDGVAGLLRYDEQYPVYARTRLAGLRAGTGGLLLAPAGDGSSGRRKRLESLVAAVAGLASGCPEALAATATGAHSAPVTTIRALAAGLEVRIAPGADSCQVSALRQDARSLPPVIEGWARAHADPADRAMAVLSHVLALNMQEDFVLMKAPSAPLQSGASADAVNVAVTDAVADAMVVGFPSGWSPPEKIGKGLSDIHAPVADGAALRRASAGLSLAMLEKGPFVRYVWTLCANPALDRRPKPDRAPVPSLPTPRGPEDLWFRCERQTTLALPAQGRALFLIRVYQAPLGEAASTAARRAQLVAALRSMSAAVIGYKNIGLARQIVLDAWGQAAPEAP